jgi:hypothetical protein
MHQKLSLFLLLAIAGTESIANTAHVRLCVCLYLAPDIFQVALGLALSVDLVLRFFFFASMSVIAIAGSHYQIYPLAEILLQ